MNTADQLKQLEEQLLDPAVRHNSALVASLLADDFIEFGSSGRIFDKASVIEDLQNEPIRMASLLEDFSTRALSPDIVLVTYRVTRRDAAGEPIGQSRRSSIWAHVNGQWQITFHQGTPIPVPTGEDHLPQK